MSCRSIEKKLDEIFSGLFWAGEPGAAVLVTKDDSIIYDKGFGVSDLETNGTIDHDTMFNICSVSKQFAAVAVLKLAEEGKLSLQDSVTKYFPQLHQPFYKRIGIHHLLSHTSGIPDSRPRTEDEWVEYRKKHPSIFSNLRDYKLFCEEEESLRYLESLEKLNFEPGASYEYENPTYQMLLSVIEQASGRNFDDWMQENIFVPAGMKETVYFEKNIEIPRMARGYERDNKGNWKISDYGTANFFGTKADGGIYTSPLEFLNWDKAIFTDRLMREESREMAHSGKIDTDIPFTQYGYGWFIETKPGRPKKIYHTGDNGGFYIFEGRFPDLNLFYLIFATHPHWKREETVEKVDRILLKAISCSE